VASLLKEACQLSADALLPTRRCRQGAQVIPRSSCVLPFRLASCLFGAGLAISTHEGSGKAATAAQILSVPGNITQLRIRGEFRTGPEQGGLDNVQLGVEPVNMMRMTCAGACVPFYAFAAAPPAALGARSGAELLARRKRSALTGGALGTAALAAVATTVWAVYYCY
jgi:hypothetical protein